MLYREWAWSTTFRQIYQYSSQRTAQILTCLYTVAAPVTSATSAGHNVLPAIILLHWLSILRARALALGHRSCFLHQCLVAIAYIKALFLLIYICLPWPSVWYLPCKNYACPCLVLHVDQTPSARTIAWMTTTSAFSYSTAVAIIEVAIIEGSDPGGSLKLSPGVKRWIPRALRQIQSRQIHFYSQSSLMSVGHNVTQ